MKYMYDSEKPIGERISFVNRAGDVLAQEYWVLVVKIGEDGNDSVQLGAWKDGQKIVATWEMGKQ